MFLAMIQIEELGQITQSGKRRQRLMVTMQLCSRVTITYFARLVL